MSELTDTFYLGRSSRYANPLEGNDRLPIVYGDLTDGTKGIWQLPCIDTVNHVYAYADHQVLSVAGGNSIAIYADNVLVGAGYTFDESNDYESKGVIATVTFTSDQVNAVITAKGKGKVSTGTTLMENVIDIVNDFLTVENTFTSTIYESTAKARAAQIFTAQGYKAAGVINEDVSIWETVVDMMGSFLGSSYLDGSGALVLMIDDGVTPGAFGQAALIPYGDRVITDARIRLANIINQCPASYAYNYAAGEFSRHTNSSAHADIISQGVFGVREPKTPYQFYWCRDLTTVQAIQDIIVAKLKDQIYEIEFDDLSLRRINVDIGDTIICTVEFLYDAIGSALYNQYWKVTSVRPDYANNKINFRALQLPAYLTSGGVRDTTRY
jgi:hypothetical protein